MSVFLSMGKQNKHSSIVCKTNANPLKFIVTDAETNFVQDLYHQLHFRDIMKQAKPSWNRLCFFFMYNIMDDLKQSVTFMLNTRGFSLMRKQNIEEPLP